MNTLTVNNITAIRKKVFLLPSSSPAKGMVAIPETVAAMTSMCHVLSRGKGVSPFISKGDTVMCENMFSDRQNLRIGSAFFCDESRIFAVIKAGMLYPIGRKVLIQREMGNLASAAGIITPEITRYQSLEGRIIRLGLTRDRFKIKDINPGDRIRLTRWENHMVEIELPDNQGYGLIVNESDLLCKYEA